MSATERSLYATSRESEVSFTSLKDERCIGLEGFLIDTIEEVSNTGIEVPQMLSNAEQWVKFFTEVNRMCAASDAKNQDIYKSNKRRSEACWRVPISDIERTPRQENIRATLTAFEGHRVMLARSQAMHQPPTLPTQDEYAQWLELITETSREEPAALYRVRVSDMVNKGPYLTYRGYVGMGPLQTQPGDVVAVFLGAKLPYILRARGEERYLLVGEAYCDGIMDGEAMSQLPKQTLVLV
jgi:hypothetical protein